MFRSIYQFVESSYVCLGVYTTVCTEQLCMFRVYTTVCINQLCMFRSNTTVCIEQLCMLRSIYYSLQRAAMYVHEYILQFVQNSYVCLGGFTHKHLKSSYMSDIGKLRQRTITVCKEQLCKLRGIYQFVESSYVCLGVYTSMQRAAM